MHLIMVVRSVKLNGPHGLARRGGGRLPTFQYAAVQAVQLRGPTLCGVGQEDTAESYDVELRGLPIDRRFRHLVPRYSTNAE